MIRILADENCDRLIVTVLRDAGYEVNYVAETLAGASDDELFGLASENGFVLLTDDLDFGRLAELHKECPPAVVLMRLDPLSRSARSKRILEALDGLGDDVLGQFVVVEPGQVRLRQFGNE